MDVEDQTARHSQDQQEKTQSRVLPPPCSSVSAGELGEVEVFFRAAESKPLGEPTVERWTQFNEHVMDRVSESLQRTRSFRQRCQTWFDRFVASDSRLKERIWVIAAAVVLLVVVLVLACLLI